MVDIDIISYEGSHSANMRNKDDALLGPAKWLRSVSTETLAQNFTELLEALSEALTLPDNLGSFKVDTLDIQLELTAEGKIGLLGNGGKVGGKGSLTLRLKR